FRKRFAITKAAIVAPAVPFAAAARFKACVELLQNDLKPIIELRNKFAHGQWAYLLTNDEQDVNSMQMAAFKKENFMTLQLKGDLVEHLANILNDLVVSTAFDRDFDRDYDRIEACRSRLRVQCFTDYRRRLQERYKRGQSK